MRNCKTASEMVIDHFPVRSALSKVLFALFLMFVPMQYVMAQINISTKSVKLEKVIQTIKSQSQYRFFYNDELGKVQVKAIDLKNADIKTVLNTVLEGTDIEYRISENVIYLTKKGEKSEQVKKSDTQKRTVKGKVTDENGEPIIGASVIVKGLNTGVVTDIDGNFSIDAPEGSKVEVSYLGYTSKTIGANKESVSVSLHQDEQLLNEVVVTALGIKKEAKALSYNVQQFQSSDITAVKDANFMNSLAGKIAGVEINSSSAGIGGGVKVVMRGSKSISNNNNALYVIDGIPMPSLQTTQPTDYFSGQGQSGDGISMINPEDIESMSVLSGAAASALYGSDAQNGVIMIKTRRGKANQTNVTYSNNTSFYSPFITPDFQNTYGAATGEFQSWGGKLATASTS